MIDAVTSLDFGILLIVEKRYDHAGICISLEFPVWMSSGEGDNCENGRERDFLQCSL